MITYQLRGLAEGIVGASTVEAKSSSDLIKKYPALKTIRHKFTIKNNRVVAFAACDG